MYTPYVVEEEEDLYENKESFIDLYDSLIDVENCRMISQTIINDPRYCDLDDLLPEVEVPETPIETVEDAEADYVEELKPIEFINNYYSEPQVDDIEANADELNFEE